MIRKIAVPVDFSIYSLNAAYYAANVARQKGATLTLVHVYFNPVINPISYDHFYSFPANAGETLAEIVDNANEMMTKFKDTVNNYLIGQKLSSVKIDTELIGGIAEEAILDFVKAGDYDLMIIGVRGKETTDNWFGTFMTEIINKATIPVLAIPGQALYRNSIFKRLLYATNFDKSDGLALRKLIEIARPLETHISIVHIGEKSDNPFINYNMAHFEEQFAGDEYKAIMEYDLIVNKSRASGIEKFIIDKQIDIIAVTSHKRNIITSLFKPSLTKELLFRLRIPMLIFHS
jgi:nucleotide-binding universal stress UspA family protein